MITDIRLAGQQLAAPRFDTPKKLISWMGAIQAQDYAMARWAVGIRLKSATARSVGEAFSRGEILRTHVMRPTWHLVAAEDIRWMLKLSARRIRSANESLNRLLDASAGEGTVSASLRRELTDMLAEAYSDLKQKQHRAPQAGYVRITAYDPPEEETARTPVIETVEELQRRGYAPGDIAVLVRTNAQGVAVARQLLDYKASRPDTPYCYDVVTQEALQIGNSDTVGFIIAVLQIASSPDDRIRIAFYNR